MIRHEHKKFTTNPGVIKIYENLYENFYEKLWKCFFFGFFGFKIYYFSDFLSNFYGTSSIFENVKFMICKLSFFNLFNFFLITLIFFNHLNFFNLFN